MALPQFVKSGVPGSPLVFPRGPEYNDDYQKIPNQLIAYTEAKQVRVATLGPPEVMLPLMIPGVPMATWLAVEAWLDHALINWAANTFTYVDVDAASWLVRCVTATFTRPRTSAGICTISLQLRKEVV